MRRNSDSPAVQEKEGVVEDRNMIPVSYQAFPVGVIHHTDENPRVEI
jgi:hypothetical protein